MKNFSRGLFVWAFVLAVIALAFFLWGDDAGGTEHEIDFSQLVQKVEQHEVKEVRIKGQRFLSRAFDKAVSAAPGQLLDASAREVVDG